MVLANSCTKEWDGRKRISFGKCIKMELREEIACLKVDEIGQQCKTNSHGARFLATCTRDLKISFFAARKVEPASAFCNDFGKKLCACVTWSCNLRLWTVRAQDLETVIKQKSIISQVLSANKYGEWLNRAEQVVSCNLRPFFARRVAWKIAPCDIAFKESNALKMRM